MHNLTDSGTSWLLDLSGRLMILGWFTLAGLAFGLLCGVAAARSLFRSETLGGIRLAA